MTTEITKKQAILLTILGIVLVVVLYVQLLIRPTLSGVSETKEKIQTLNEQYQSLLQQSESYDQNLEALEGWREANSEETNRLYPLSKPERIDNFLNFVIGECGATITSLTVMDAMQYYVDGENNLVLADPDAVDGTDAADAAAGTQTANEGDAAATGENETAAYVATGEYRMDFTYTMTGNYEDMNQLLKFVDRVSFLGLTSYSFNSIPEEETGAFVDEYTFTMTISAYMYKDPLKTAEEAEAKDEQASEAPTEEALAAA